MLCGRPVLGPPPGPPGHSMGIRGVVHPPPRRACGAPATCWGLAAKSRSLSGAQQLLARCVCLPWGGGMLCNCSVHEAEGPALGQPSWGQEMTLQWLGWQDPAVTGPAWSGPEGTWAGHLTWVSSRETRLAACPPHVCPWTRQRLDGPWEGPGKIPGPQASHSSTPLPSCPTPPPP